MLCSSVSIFNLSYRLHSREHGRAECRLQNLESKLISGCEHLAWFYAVAAEQDSVGHFAHREAEHKRRSRKNGRSMQHTGKQTCEFLVSHRVWRHDIYGTAHLLVGNRVADDSDHVFDRNPRHPLLPAAEAATNSELEWCEHLRQRATFAGENNPGAQHDRTNASLGGAAGFSFPVTADQCEEVCPVGARFGENFVASRSVVADCRSDDQHSRFLLEPRKRIDQDARGVDAAGAKKLFA